MMHPDREVLSAWPSEMIGGNFDATLVVFKNFTFDSGNINVENKPFALKLL